MAINMKYSIIIMLFLSAKTTAGNIYTFDEPLVRKAALDWILSRHHKFSYTKLKHKHSIPSINKNGKLIKGVRPLLFWAMPLIMHREQIKLWVIKNCSY